MAHLLEHLVFKGTPKHPDIPKELSERGARLNGTTWFDRTNYYETFTATDENLEWALDLEADRMVNSFIAQDGPRHRDDRRAQRVRARREQPARRADAARPGRPRISGTTTASRRSARAPTSRTSPSSGCRRSTGRTTSPTTPCSWSPGKFDEAETLRALGTEVSARSRSRRAAAATLHGGAGAGRRADRHAAPRRRHADRGRRAITCPAGAHIPTTRARRRAGGRARRSPSGRLYKALVETKKAASVCEQRSGAARPRRVSILRAGAHGDLARRRARRDARDARGCGQRRFRRRGVERARARAAQEHRRRARRLRQRSASACQRVDRGRRLAPVLPPARPLAQGHGRRTSARGAAST